MVLDLNAEVKERSPPGFSAEFKEFYFIIFSVQVGNSTQMNLFLEYRQDC